MADHTDRIVGQILVTETTAGGTLGAGPFVTDICADPAVAGRRLGTALLAASTGRLRGRTHRGTRSPASVLIDVMTQLPLGAGRSADAAMTAKYTAKPTLMDAGRAHPPTGAGRAPKVRSVDATQRSGVTAIVEVGAVL